MAWQWREYDPFLTSIAEQGPITQDAALALLHAYDWKTPLAAIEARPKEVQHAPGFEITDTAGRSFYVGGSGDSDVPSFVVAYVRPKFVKRLTLFGFKEKMDPEHYTDKEVATLTEVEQLLTAFLEGRSDELERSFSR